MEIKYKFNLIGTEIIAGVTALASVLNHDVTYLQAVLYFLLWWFIGFMVWDIIDVIAPYLSKLITRIQKL